MVRFGSSLRNIIYQRQTARKRRRSPKCPTLCGTLQIEYSLKNGILSLNFESSLIIGHQCVTKVKLQMSSIDWKHGTVYLATK